MAVDIVADEDVLDIGGGCFSFLVVVVDTTATSIIF